MSYSERSALNAAPPTNTACTGNRNSAAWSIRSSRAPRRLIAAGAEISAQISIDADGADIRELPSAARHFFHVTLATGAACCWRSAAWRYWNRRIFAISAVMPTRDDRRIRWGQLYRSDNSIASKALDQQQIAALNIRLVCDSAAIPSANTPQSLCTGHTPRIENLAIAPGSSANLFEGGGDEGFSSTARN